MKKPDFFLVLGEYIPIEYVEPQKIDNDYGEYCRETKVIKINKRAKPEGFVSTLIHELVHAIADRGGVHQAISHELEEIIAEQFAKVIDENFKLTVK